MSKQRKTKRSKMLRDAAVAIPRFRDLGTTKWTADKQQRYNERRLGTFGAASPVRIIVKGGEPASDGIKAAVSEKKKFKRLKKPNEYLMLKTERKERDQDVFFNMRTGGTIAARAEKAEKEWRSRLNLDANLHRTARRSAGVNR
jgi:hypothetical protein